MKKTLQITLSQMLIFCIMIIFFTKISPLILFDADDWLFNGTMRGPYPLWGAFNPTRVLPEILDPVGSYVASFIVYPFTRDYVGSITLVQSIIVSLFVVLLCYSFFVLLNKGFKYSKNVSLVSEAFLFLSFFLLFKHLNHPSYTAFWTVDLTCAFFYLIPGLLNGYLVLTMAKEDDFCTSFNKYSNVRKGIFILLFYFALFSNSQFNVIIATYSFGLLIQSIWHNKSKLFCFEYLRKSWIYFLILIIWILTIIFDLRGGRSTNLNQSNLGSNNFKLKILLGQFKLLLGTFNKGFVIVGILLFIITCIILLKSKNSDDQKLIKTFEIILLSIILSWLYLMIAYFKAIPRYAGRPDAMWPVIFYFLLIIALSVSYLINRFKLIKIITPLLITICYFIAFNFSCRPIPSISGLTPNMGSNVAKKIDQYIINQIVVADKRGNSKVIVKVPKGSLTDNNWPQSYYMEGAISQSLYVHHIIKHRIKVVFKPDFKVNKRFNPNVNDQPYSPLEK